LVFVPQWSEARADWQIMTGHVVTFDDPAEALEFVVSSWLRTSYLMAEPGFREALEMLPELSKESKPMTLEQLSDRIGL